MAYPFEIKEHILPGQHIRRYPRATAQNQHDTLKVVYKQYRPFDNPTPSPGDITIIGAHANGFPKELYEPLWEEIYQLLKSKNKAIRGIWIADVAHQGQSGVLNEDKLGNDPSWFDHPLDLLHMVNVFRDEMIRPIVGIGHSLGGNNLVNLALLHPRLMESLILIDPVIQRAASVQGNYMPAMLSSRRREVWPSRREAAEAAKKSKFYQSWDLRVLERWLEHGLRDIPTALFPGTPSTTLNSEATTSTPVTLKTTKHQEVFTFLRPNFRTIGVEPDIKPELIVTTSHNRDPVGHADYDPTSGLANAPFYRAEPIITFNRLPHLLPSVLYIFGETSTLSRPELRSDKMAVTGVGVGGSGGAPADRVKEVVVKGVGHLIPMEAPKETAQHSTKWLEAEIRVWNEREARERKEWDSVPSSEKTKLSEAYMSMLHSDESLSSKGKKTKAKL
ncbi:uncharacterized protein K452DRAFT_324555 [Aplosporella prunicola CBS 121167]|uniref:AB hydrolase-1 domain-containing protein n=1 Tax=Aplosporella prunicola CBS 121167 TaxID=1176127 RepID=A0A6A6BQD0_9PEZI|nr:uncharacterized protein K452DRAFT_324555 [Aplosporella prunicola CBS 121167]KAF2145633.1 hypothetical protein K452DRAFT_324555 [Aplosporella prunicola CBS 121167]